MGSNDIISITHTDGVYNTPATRFAGDGLTSTTVNAETSDILSGDKGKLYHPYRIRFDNYGNLFVLCGGDATALTFTSPPSHTSSGSSGFQIMVIGRVQKNTIISSTSDTETSALASIKASQEHALTTVGKLELGVNCVDTKSNNNIKAD